MTSVLSTERFRSLWRLKHRKSDVAYYIDNVTVAAQARFRCVTHMHAGVHDIMKLFVVPTNESIYRKYRLLCDSLLDARVLSVLRRPTDPWNRLSLHFQLTKSSRLDQSRVCLAVATEIMTQPDESILGYCVWDSIDDLELSRQCRLNRPSSRRVGCFNQ
ncbi:hypothetical protein CCR75_005591 [Bremia lactucae]|uniref:Uncharacterized protein n=1 Tax=Bremia lactucae TaxID=4779 RepID=A0A976ILJ3_BRELC|nr:hypothetical protein CCR75_005591 [Bremia lactucae]